MTYFWTSCEIHLLEHESLLFYFPEALGVIEALLPCVGKVDPSSYV